MSWPLVALSLYQMYTEYQRTQKESEGIKKQAEYQYDVSQMNARLSEYQAGEALRTGNEVVKQIGKAKSQVIGSQRAAFAAQGLDITSGSAMDIQKETEKNAEIDILTAKNNAWKEAWGYKVSALQSTMQGEFIKTGAKQQIESTLLSRDYNLATGALGVYSAYKGGK